MANDHHARGVRLDVPDWRYPERGEVVCAIIGVVNEVGHRLQSAGETLPQDGLRLGRVEGVRDQYLRRKVHEWTQS